MSTTGERTPYRFAIVGAGWRTTFFLRVVSALGERFNLEGVLTRSLERAREVEATYGVRASADLQDLLGAGRAEFVVLSVPRSATVGLLEELTRARTPVLCETPPAPDVEGLQRVSALVASGARVQVAEQYQYQPLHSARLALTDGGVIGDVSMASLGVCHDYHAFSLMRRHLKITGEPAALRASVVRSKVESGFGTSGPRRSRGVVEEVRTVGIIEFSSGHLGTYDFADQQYFSYIRSPRVVLRGSQGEIADHDVRVINDLDRPVTMELHREQTGEDGDLGGNSLRGISMGDKWVYTNPFPGARLSDDEIAIATELERMGRYSRGGEAFYGLADACQDHYLSLCLHRAAATAEPVRTERQPWSDALLGAKAIGGEPLGPVVEDLGTSKGRL
jgi:predicted dehydrogenase